MRLLILMTVILQNGIIAVPNQPPEILEQLKELQQHIKRLETDGRKLMDENENFKRQIDGLMKSKVVLYADMEDKIASQNDKIASQADTIHIMQEKLNGEFTSKQNELKSKIDQTAASVEIMKNTSKPVVAFRATCAKNFPNSDSYKGENPVIWKNVEYNIGSAYDASNGKFTCPHDGVYSFYATSPIIGSKRSGNISIYVNGSEKVNHHAHNGYSDIWVSNGNLSPQGVFKLSKGDTVHINMNGRFFYASSKCIRTYFQGHLIDPL